MLLNRIIAHPIQSNVSVRNAPITLHGYGAFDMEETYLLKGDKSLSIKNSRKLSEALPHNVCY